MRTNRGFDYDFVSKHIKYLNYELCDNDGTIYDSVGDVFKGTFYAREKDENGGYVRFNLDGISLCTPKLKLTLYEIVDMNNEKYITDSNGPKSLSIFKLKDNKYLYLNKHGIIDVKKIEDMESESETKNYHKMSYDEITEAYNILYDLDIAYDPVKLVFGELVKHLEKGHIYSVANSTFKASHDFVHDMRNISSIPYEYNVVYLPNGNVSEVYENSTMGLPARWCVMNATANEILSAWDAVREKRGVFGVKVINLRVGNKEDLNDLKYLFEVQLNNIHEIIISDETEEDYQSLFPEIKYRIYVKDTLYGKLVNDNHFIYLEKKYDTDYYDEMKEMPSVERRAFGIEKVFVVK